MQLISFSRKNGNVVMDDYNNLSEVVSQVRKQRPNNKVITSPMHAGTGYVLTMSDKAPGIAIGIIQCVEGDAKADSFLIVAVKKLLVTLSLSPTFTVFMKQLTKQKDFKVKDMT